MALLLVLTAMHGAMYGRDDVMRPPLTYDPTCSPKLLGNNTNAAAHDLAQTHEPQSADECMKACCDEPRCGGVLWQPIAQQTWSACIQGQPCCFLKTQVAYVLPWPDPFPGGSFVYEMVGRPQDNEKLQFLSATLGSHMVLQQAPHSATIWGFTAPGARVTTTMAPSDAAACRLEAAAAAAAACEAAQTFVTFADDDGTWRQKLPPTPASKAAFRFHIAATNASAPHGSANAVSALGAAGAMAEAATAPRAKEEASMVDAPPPLAEASMVDVLFGEVYMCA